MDNKNFVVLFDLNEIRPDGREFRMNSSLFTSNLKVQVKVPRDTEHIANLEELTKAELSATDRVPDVVLTALGAVYVLKEFETAYDTLKPILPKLEVTEEDEWKEVANKESQLNPGKLSSSGSAWEDEVSFDESTEKPDKEDWNVDNRSVWNDD